MDNFLVRSDGSGIDAKQLAFYADEIDKALSLGVSIAVVIGGGNIYRGAQVTGLEIPRLQGDYIGMRATAINGLALQSALKKEGYLRGLWLVLL